MSNSLVKVGQKHPDFEFCYCVGHEENGNPIYTTRVFIPKSLSPEYCEGTRVPKTE